MFYIFSFWPYATILLMIIVLSFSEYKRFSSLFIFISIFTMSALRYDVGWDYSEYVGLIESGVDKVNSSRMEPLSKVLLSLGAYLKFYPIVFIFYSFLTLFVVHKMISRFSASHSISWLVYFCMPLFFLASLSTIRQSLSMALVFYSFMYLFNNKIEKYILVVIIASLFHYSALIGILLLLLYKWPFNLLWNYLIIASSFFLDKFVRSLLSILITGSDAISSRYVAFYLDADLPSNTKLQYIYYAFSLINLLFFKKLISINANNRFYIAISSFGILVYNVFSFEPVTASRLSAFFLMFWVFIISDYPKLFEIESRQVIRFSIYFILLLMFVLYMNIYVAAFESGRNEKISFIPYKTWIFNF